MIKSEGTILRTLKAGGHVRKGGHNGHWLVASDGTKKRVLSQTVRALETARLIVRTDDRSSRVGATWGYGKI